MVDGSRARAAARSSWPVRRFKLGEEPDEDLSASTTAEQRLGMMWELTVAAWQLSGSKIPDYQRDETPVRVVRSTP